MSCSTSVLQNKYLVVHVQRHFGPPNAFGMLFTIESGVQNKCNGELHELHLPYTRLSQSGLLFPKCVATSRFDCCAHPGQAVSLWPGCFFKLFKVSSVTTCLMCLWGGRNWKWALSLLRSFAARFGEGFGAGLQSAATAADRLASSSLAAGCADWKWNWSPRIVALQKVDEGFMADVHLSICHEALIHLLRLIRHDVRHFANEEVSQGLLPWDLLFCSQGMEFPVNLFPLWKRLGNDMVELRIDR